MYGNITRFNKRLERGYLPQAKGISQHVLDILKDDPYIIHKIERTADRFRRYLSTDRLTVYLNKGKVKNG